MPRTIVVLSSMYIIVASSREYEDRVVGISPFPLVFENLNVIFAYANLPLIGSKIRSGREDTYGII